MVSKILRTFAPNNEPQNGWWLWVGVLWKQSKAERGIENGFQIVTHHISQSPELPLFIRKIAFSSKITELFCIAHDFCKFFDAMKEKESSALADNLEGMVFHDS